MLPNGDPKWPNPLLVYYMVLENKDANALDYHDEHDRFLTMNSIQEDLMALW